jgi:hypothetical protein
MRRIRLENRFSGRMAQWSAIYTILNRTRLPTRSRIFRRGPANNTANEQINNWAARSKPSLALALWIEF